MRDLRLRGSVLAGYPGSLRPGYNCGLLLAALTGLLEEKSAMQRILQACIALWWAAITPAVGQTIEVPGAGPPSQLLKALAGEFNTRHAPLRVEIPPSSGQSGAIDAVVTGRAQLGRYPRRLNAEEERKGLTYTPIAREPIVFATGKDVTVTNVSRAQLATIFAGRITNWAEIGGKAAPIRVLYREETAESLRIIRSRLPEFAALKFTEHGRMLNLDFEVTEGLERLAWGIGWGSAGNVRAAKGLRVLSLDGIAPSAGTIVSGQYPLYFETVLLYKREPLKGVAKAFHDFAVSAAGRGVIEAFGAVPVDPQ
jgi:phosphate transport system substrate-binding protein